MATLALALAIAAQVVPASISLQPSGTIQLADNAQAGTLVSTATVKNSDGSTAAACNLTSSMPSLFAVAGCKIVTARALSKTDDGSYNATITAWPLQTSAAGTIACAPGSAPAQYCKPNASALQWQGHTFAFLQPATVAAEKGNYTLQLDGKAASCGGTVGEWSGFELAIDVKGQLYMQSFDNGSPGWSTYGDRGTDACFGNYGETPPSL